mmetsp:Transcript_15455/g.26149  ORF Transcript_15455/g.26149 Transcript_15455/m.26149 type:complete len:127 (+) Transcript_15455:1559-1939(+)
MKLDFDSKDKSRFWLPLKAKDGKTGREITNGKVKIQVDILPADQADKNPVGKARQDPNHSPSLPQPEGRVELSLNPIKMFNQMVGPEIRRKIIMGLCLILCCTIFLTMLPTILGNLITQGITSLFD